MSNNCLNCAKKLLELDIAANRMNLPGGFKSVIPNGLIRNINS